ncbi:MAG: DsbC family protein, partial [Gammaproteobacteria bacterium]
TGTFFVVGDVYQRVNQRIVNLSDQRRMEDRKALLLTLDESEMVVFDSIAERKASITVFTDIDCGFCRKLHQEVPSLNQMGVAVRYLAYPRAGVGSDSFDKIVSAWCAPDPKRALTLAKSLQPIDAKTCDNPVSDHLQLGSRMGVTGTPAIVLDNGRLVPGYLPAERLAAELGLSAGS